MTTITVFKGDGIGPEITDAVIKVLNAAGADLEYEFFNVGAKVYEETKEYIPEKAFESYEKNKILLKSPITTPVGKGFRSLNVTLRNKYDLWANIRPAKSNPCIPTRFENVDIVTFRENTEDLYVGKEEQIDENTVYAYKIITNTISSINIIGNSIFVPACSPAFLARAFLSSRACSHSSLSIILSLSFPFTVFCSNIEPNLL